MSYERAAATPAPASAAVRDASFTASARALLKEIPPHVRDGFSKLAAKKDERAGNAQSLVDAIGALEVSVGVHARPVPSAAAFASDGGASSAASGNAPPSGNPAPRRRRRASTADNL